MIQKIIQKVIEKKERNKKNVNKDKASLIKIQETTLVSLVTTPLLESGIFIIHLP